MSASWYTKYHRSRIPRLYFEVFHFNLPISDDDDDNDVIDEMGLFVMLVKNKFVSEQQYGSGLFAENVKK